MSRFKNVPGVAWLLIGVCGTALVVPSAAFAAGALTFTGIEGKNTNKADATSANQLMTSAASPGSFVDFLLAPSCGVDGRDWYALRSRLVMH